MNTKQIKQLKSFGHTLSPVVTVGQHGMKESINNEIEIALDYHQLIKLKINLGDREQRDELIQSLAEQHKAMLVQRIGNVALFYRENKDKPSIFRNLV
ncbi:YhbY family RNA-binding protein [Leucothrix mucor]|uniref:YhbY family RNA-binding protein n=1 Tax=Leucothrix mucor TaxID=45248 RepID=UPI001FDFBC62|nr:YhbY family RNA-binding protein [Leucothrix mucor]